MEAEKETLEGNANGVLEFFEFSDENDGVGVPEKKY